MDQGHFELDKVDSLFLPGLYSEKTARLYELNLTTQPVSLFKLYKFLYISQWPQLVNFLKAFLVEVTKTGSYQRVAGSEEFLGGLTVPFPLWNFRQREIAKAKGMQYQAEAHLQQAQNELRKGITEQIQISKTASAQIQTFEKGLLMHT